MLIIIAFFLAHWYFSIFAQTFFLHRYAAHRMFTMSPFWEKFFFLFTYIAQGSSYLSPRSYAILHRMHHAYTDTEHDPHSPTHQHNLFQMMWETKDIYNKIGSNVVDIEPRFLKNLPEWKAFDRFADHMFSRILWGVLYTLFYIQFAPSWWLFLLLPIHWLMGPVHGVIINWFAHTIGYRNFESEDTSTNYLPFDFLTMGEGYHNNHHKYSARANFGGIRWHELDLSWLIIRTLNALGIIQLKKAVA
ncbi:MAG: acyl-CoA desaturase [Chitinophagales bacterium]